MVDLVPTETMANNARRGLEMREEFGRGGTAVGVARARDIANRKELSPRTINRMVSFFARHEVDKEAEGYRAGEDGYPSAGKIANLLWGGDSGYAWAKSKQRALENEKSQGETMKKTFTLTDLKMYGDEEERKFEGYASTFGNEDRHGDIVVNGAFAASLQQHVKEGTMPAMLLHHDMKRPIGKWTSVKEDATGLRVAGTLTKGVRDADEAYALLKDGALNSMSIGYIPVKEEYDRKTGANLLQEVKLHEISLVTIPANQAALVSGVKDADGELNVREIERALREAGLSRREAKALLAEGYKALTPQEDAVEESVPERDAKADERQQRLKAMLDKLNNI